MSGGSSYDAYDGDAFEGDVAWGDVVDGEVMEVVDEPVSPPWQARPRRRTAALLAFGVAAALVGGAGYVGLRSFGGEADTSRADSGPSEFVPATTATTAAVTPPPPTSSAVPSVADPRLAAAEEFLAAWEEGRYADMQALVNDQSYDLVRVYGGMAERLRLTSVDVTAGTFDPVSGALPFDVTLTLDGLGTTTYSSSVLVTGGGPTWAVRWTADTVYPGLVAGERLDLVTTPSLAEIVDVSGAPLAGDPDLSANLVGTVGPDGLGQSGLRKALQGEPAGAAASALAVVNGTTGETLRVVQTWTPTAPPLATTLDLRVQAAATEALRGAPARAALVAVDVSDGGVLAVANNPVDGLPVALAGTYPPGSTFKIVTAGAALRAGASAADTLACPPSVSVTGKTFDNASSVPSGDMTLSRAFAVSCNTAFVGLALGEPGTRIADVAADLGFDATSPLPVRSWSGEVPAPGDDIEAAAQAIGQGRVTASPLHMASVAAAVASGTWRAPHVIACDCEARTFPEAAGVRAMMREAVVSGTASALAGVPGGEVYAKTGTAEASGGAHAWTVGFQGDVAFAVLVEHGGSGGQVAAPLAARFLTALAGAGAG